MNPDPGPFNFPIPDQFPDGDEADADEPNVDEIVDAAIDYEVQQRLWLRAIIPLLQLRSQETDPSPRVQLAFDLMQIAAAERVGRLMRSDLSAEQH
jgi:hypothetical protein